MVKILDGKIVRDKIAEDLKVEISRWNLSSSEAKGSKPKLVIIQVGDLPESNTYIRQKVLFGERIGAIVDHQKFPENIDQEKLIAQISDLNSQPSVHGIIVQQPLPNHLEKDKIIDSIDPVKDVDGQTATNIKLLFEGSYFRHPRESEDQTFVPRTQSQGILDQVENDNGAFSGYIPATTKGIFTLLDFYKIPVEGKHVVVVGRSTLVGKPTALLALNKNATVTICHSKTNHLSLITSHSDILIVAAGKPKLITRDHVSKNQVVIDVGINVIASESEAISNKIATNSSSSHNDKKVKPETEPGNRKLVGDVDFEEVSKIVSAISPVPGGVGPMTVASLFQNLLAAHQKQNA